MPIVVIQPSQDSWKEVLGTPLNPICVIQGWNETNSEWQSMRFEVKDFDVSRNNATIGTDLGNMRLQVDNDGAHIGFNLTGTSYSQIVVYRDGSNDTYLGIRGAAMASGSDLTEEARLWMRNAGATLQSYKGYVNIEPFSAETRITTSSSPLLSFYTAGGVRRGYIQPNTSTNKLRIHSDLSGGVVFQKSDGGEIGQFNSLGLVLPVAGLGISIKEGVNAKAGVATLSSGTVTVNTTAITANSRVHLTRQSPNASTAIGHLSLGTVTAGASFVINSLKSDATTETGDDSAVYWQINEAA